MFYADLYKPVKNVLGGAYGSTTKFTVRTKPNADLKLEFNADRNPDEKSIASYLKWTQAWKSGNIGYSLSGQLDGEGTVDVNGTAGNVFKGLDVGLDAKLKTDKTSKDNKVHVFTTYKHEVANIRAGVEKKYGKDALLTASVTSSYEGIIAGVEGKFNVYPLPKTQKDALQGFNFGLRYSTNNLHVVSQCEDFEKVKIGVAQEISKDFNIAAEFSHNVKPDDKGVVSAPVWTFGVNYNIDADSSYGFKGDTKGTVNVLYKVRVNPRITTTLSAEANMNDLTKDTKFGVAFDIEA